MEPNNVSQGGGMSGGVDSGTVHTQEQNRTERKKLKGGNERESNGTELKEWNDTHAVDWSNGVEW